MQEILVINACVRTESRTKMLTDYLLDKLEGNITIVDLQKEQALPLDGEQLIIRQEALAQNNMEHPILDYAHQFAKADVIVIAAPYWDLSFPALLKAYLERVCVVGVTFAYSEDEQPYGMCKASKLYYVTTAGGPIYSDEQGYGYVRLLCEKFFEIGDTRYVKAEGLDLLGADVEKILEEAKKTIDEWDNENGN